MTKLFGLATKPPEPVTTPQQRLEQATANLRAAGEEMNLAFLPFQSSGWREAQRQKYMQAQDKHWRAQKAYTLALREVQPFVPLQPAKTGGVQ